MNDNQIEQMIRNKGKTAPRITPADIEENITGEYYFTASDGVAGKFAISKPDSDCDIAPSVANDSVPQSLELLTFCVLVLKNGFTVTGESACASPENFDPEIGRTIARKNAFDKIWPLMGYELKQRLNRV